MVLSSLTHFGERLRAGVDIVGIANFKTFLAKTSAYRQDLRRVEYGDERDPKMQEVLTRISPLEHVSAIRSPMLVAHGRNDPRVPFGEAEAIAKAARSNGLEVWTVFAADEGHGFAKKRNVAYLDGLTAQFFERFLVAGTRKD
jgi:dipeptidyl aminopeptidase/acylaminoacyl peptidase